jgi:hypothetical protein
VTPSSKNIHIIGKEVGGVRLVAARCVIQVTFWRRGEGGERNAGGFLEEEEVEEGKVGKVGRRQPLQ